MSTDPATLLREFLANRSEAAFSALVRIQIDLVYSAARRICAGDTHLAEDITQTVFADLARKAARLPGDVVLSAWLYRHTFFVASSMIRAERRRRTREQEAVAMNAVHESTEPDWALLAPHLDEAMNALAEADRLALVLRYFDKLDLRSVGERLGVSEDTAQKRVARALERLKTRFADKGLSVSLSALAASLLAHAVSAAPVLLAAQTASIVLAGTATGSGILLALEKLLTMNALKPIAAALALAGVATPLFLQQQSLAALRDQKASLGAQVAELDAVRTDNRRLERVSVDYRELERLREEHLELLRLRGEATLMRNELDALKREFERHRQLLLARGVSEEELLSQEQHQANRQILIESRFSEVPLISPIWAEFGLRPPTNAKDEGGHTVLNADTAKRLLERLAESTGIDMLAAPRVATMNGRQAQLKVVDIQTIVSGRSGEEFQAEPMEFGSVLDVVPTLAREGGMLQLTAIASVTQFLGYDDPEEVEIVVVDENQAPAIPLDTPLPRINLRQMQADVTLASGQVLVMSGGYSGPHIKPTTGEKPEALTVPTGLIVFVTSTEIDSAGNRVSLPED